MHALLLLPLLAPLALAASSQPSKHSRHRHRSCSCDRRRPPRPAFKNIHLRKPSPHWQPFLFGNTRTLAYHRFVLRLRCPALLQVTDAFCNGDAFSVYDNGAPLGDVVPRGLGVTCNCCQVVERDPQKAYDNIIFANGQFELTPGKHLISIQSKNAVFGGGMGFLRVIYPPGSPCNRPHHHHRRHRKPCGCKPRRKPCGCKPRHHSLPQPPCERHHSSESSSSEHHHAMPHPQPAPDHPNPPSPDCGCDAPKLQVIQEQGSFAQASALCAAHGLALAAIRSDTFSEASRQVYNALGPKGAAWIASFNGDTYGGACLVFSVGDSFPSGNINLAPDCTKVQPVLCQAP